MMTIDIETISGVPLTGELKSARPEHVGADQKSEQKDDHRGGREQHADEAGVQSVKHREPSGVR